MNIALDVMGGDHAPEEIVAGAVLAGRQFGTTISLVGQPDIIRSELSKHETRGLDLPIVPATQVITMEDKPMQAAREKKDSSMAVACQLVKEGRAQAFVTAGSTGGALATGILHIGRIKGILRPALIAPFPTRSGVCAILDVGANADTRPEHLQQFAVMGRIYGEQVMKRFNPVVRLLSNGEEEGKGNQLVVTAYELLKETSNINFQGNIESKEVVSGLADIIVTDGFTGNIFLKTAEATAGLVLRVVFEEMTAGPINRVGTFLARTGLRQAKSRLDDSEYGGAVLLGLTGIVVVAHGRSHANAIRHSIRSAKQGVEHDIPGKISQGVAALIDPQIKSTVIS
ncbi:phosphate acyltransferase PlsX [Chloroflexi bacterium TSY]|nr:phosphate acyltransferase PlsX [Chloroflexi bacterium TSY]